MRHWHLPVVTIIFVVLAVVVIRHVRREHERKERGLIYRSILRSYTESLKPGMHREQVESLLRAKNVQFQQYCCDNHAYTDLIKIGSEDAPWYCSAVNDYIQFQFDGIDPVWKNPSDPLESISLITRGEDCL